MERLEASFNRFEATVSERLSHFESAVIKGMERLEASFSRLGSTVSGQVEQAETRFAQRSERTETTLLTEFHKWAAPVEARH
jgi:hypothetical protein